MNQNKKSILLRILPFLCFFIIVFSFIMWHERADIAAKEFHGFDELSNGTVTSNLTRSIFPPMVRLNPLIKEQTSWPDGPYWQHIPPLYMYVPLPFFYLLDNGMPSIDAIRMSYITVLLLGCLLFIWGVFYFERNSPSAWAATLACIYFVSSKFTTELVVGTAFNNSDILLFFSVISAFTAILWYLKEEKEIRLKYPLTKILLISIIVTLPLVVKNLLGAIPLTTFIFLLLWDGRRIFNKRLWLSMSVALGVLLCGYVPLYASSPDTFFREIVTPLYHLGSYEIYIFPWNYFLTTYLPDEYLGGGTLFFFIGLITSIFLLWKCTYTRHTRNILTLSGGWFMWNLIIVSAAKTKSANFIFQSYLLSLFFVTYSILLLSQLILRRRTNSEDLEFKPQEYSPSTSSTGYRIIVLILLLGAIYSPLKTVTGVLELRNKPAADSLTVRFNYFAEQMKKDGVSKKDLFLLYSSFRDCDQFKYYLIFHTGAESESIDKLRESNLDGIQLKERYNNIYVVLKENTTKTSLLTIPHTSTIKNHFTLITINNSDIPVNFEKKLTTFIGKLEYKVKTCKAYRDFDFFGKKL